MKKSRPLIRLGILGMMILTAIVATSFVKAPKETLKEIALRKQAEGKFIPVYLHPVNLAHKGAGVDASSLCIAGDARPVKDQFGDTYSAITIFEDRIPESYFAMVENIANQLNEGLGTTAFKAVYAKDIPTKTIKFLGREDEVADWWETDYELIMNVASSLMYVTKTGTENSTHLEFSSILYVNTVEPGKQALGNIGLGNNLGTLKSDVVTHDGCYSSLEEWGENVAGIESLSADCADMGQEAIAKFIGKEVKKYDKAMKKKK